MMPTVDAVMRPAFGRPKIMEALELFGVRAAPRQELLQRPRAREGVGWGEVAQVRHDACRWSLETCRGCAGPPGPDLAKRDLNPRIPARVRTI